MFTKSIDPKVLSLSIVDADIRYVNEGDSINMTNKRISNLANGILATDAATMAQLNNIKNFSSDVNMNQHKITNLLDGTDNMDAVNLFQMRTAISQISLYGGHKIKYGTIRFNNHGIAIIYKCRTPIIPISLLIRVYGQEKY